MAKGVFQKAESFYVDFDRKTGPDKLSTHYCPGCGHGTLHKLIAVAIDDVQAELVEGRMTAQEIVATDRNRISKTLLPRPTHVVMGGHVRRDVGDGLGIEPTFGDVNQRKRAVQVPPMGHERAEDLAGIRNFTAVRVTIQRVVAEDQLRMRAVGTNRPEGVAEIGALVQVFRTHPDDPAVLHHRRRPFAQVGVRKRANICAVGSHAKKYKGLRSPA